MDRLSAALPTLPAAAPWVGIWSCVVLKGE